MFSIRFRCQVDTTHENPIRFHDIDTDSALPMICIHPSKYPPDQQPTAEYKWMWSQKDCDSFCGSVASCHSVCAPVRCVESSRGAHRTVPLQECASAAQTACDPKTSVTTDVASLLRNRPVFNTVCPVSAERMNVFSLTSRCAPYSPGEEIAYELYLFAPTPRVTDWAVSFDYDEELEYVRFDKSDSFNGLFMHMDAMRKVSVAAGAGPETGSMVYMGTLRFKALRAITRPPVRLVHNGVAYPVICLGE